MTSTAHLLLHTAQEAADARRRAHLATSVHRPLPRRRARRRLGLPR